MISGTIINTLHRAVYRHSSCQFSLVSKIILATVSHTPLPPMRAVFSAPSCALQNPSAAPTEGALLPSTTGCCVQQAADVAPDAATVLRKLLPKSLAAKAEHRVLTNQTFAF